MKRSRHAAVAAAGDRLFAPVVAAFAGDRKVASGRMFGSIGLKVDGKVFAMLVKGMLVVKLPRARVEELVSSGAGKHFDPGHGRLMREWLAVDQVPIPWASLAREARRFVDGDRP